VDLCHDGKEKDERGRIFNGKPKRALKGSQPDQKDE